MQLGPGMVDPIFLCRLALDLKMPVGELGSRMSAHELAVWWPAYYAMVDRERARDEELNAARGR